MIINHQENVAGFAGGHTYWWLPQQTFRGYISVTTAAPLDDLITTTLPASRFKDCEIDSDDPDNSDGTATSITIGTSVSFHSDALFCINLTGLPHDLQITDASFSMEVTTGTSAGTPDEIAIEILRIVNGLPLDFDLMTHNRYDGLNLWPKTRYDNSIRLLSALKRETGQFTLDIKALVKEALRLKESQLLFVIRRVQQTANHRHMIIDSAEGTVPPVLTITHLPQKEPDTVITKSRLTVIKKWSI